MLRSIKGTDDSICFAVLLHAALPGASVLITVVSYSPMADLLPTRHSARLQSYPRELCNQNPPRRTSSPVPGGVGLAQG